MVCTTANVVYTVNVNTKQTNVIALASVHSCITNNM